MKPLRALINKNNINSIQKVFEGIPETGDLVAVLCIVGKEVSSYHYGYFTRYSETEGRIDFSYGFISWDDFEKLSNLEYHYQNYTHYVVKIYRPKNLNKPLLKPKKKEDTLVGEVESNSNYYCIYKNEKLLKEYNLL